MASSLLRKKPSAWIRECESNPPSRVAFRSAVLLLFLGCAIAVLTFASVEVSSNHASVRSAVADLASGTVGRFARERVSVTPVARRRSSGINLREAPAGSSASIAITTARNSQGSNFDAAVVTSTAPTGTGNSPNLHASSTQVDTVRVSGITNSPGSLGVLAPAENRVTPTSSSGFYAPIGPVIRTTGTSTSGTGAQCPPCVSAPEPGWAELVMTAVSVAFLFWVAGILRQWFSRQRTAPEVIP
jgi:hypothetical protein